MAKKRVSPPGLAPAARRDVREILAWSKQKFGQTAAARYKALIKQAVRDVIDDPERPGSKERPEIMIKGARTFHPSWSRVSGPGVKEPRHFLLHDGRDLARFLPGGYRREE